MKERPILFQGAMVRALLAGTKTQTRRAMKHQPKSVEWDPECNVDGECPAPWFRFTPAVDGLIEFRRPMVNQPSTKAQRGAASRFLQRYHRGDVKWSRMEAQSLCPHGQPGDRLWVKETFDVATEPGDGISYGFRADYPSDVLHIGNWRPSIFMPRQASRLTLEITSVRVERLQDISAADACAEGAAEILSRDESDPLRRAAYAHGEWSEELHDQVAGAIDAYRALWNSITLKPGAIEVRDETGKRQVIAYESFPWSNEDFDAAYPGARLAGLYRGKPLTVTANPWVWVIEFRRVTP